MRTVFLRAVAALILFVSLTAYASVTVTVNGTNHTIPQTNEKGWGTNVTAWIQAISQYSLQPTGGTFSLTAADVNFGSSYGLIGPYYKSRASALSSSGIFRMGNAEYIGWRNAADSGNLLLGVNSSNQLTYNGVVLASSSGPLFQDSLFTIFDNSDTTKLLQFQLSGITTGTTRIITMSDANVDLSDLSSATSSNTVSKIVKRDASGNFSAGTITASLTGNVTGNADTATALASNPSDCAADTYATTIAASGNLTCATVTNAGLAGSISWSKIATGNSYRILATNGSGVPAEASAITASRALISDANGIPTHATTTSTEIGYVNGVTSSLCGINQTCTLINKTLTTPVLTYQVDALSSDTTLDTTHEYVTVDDSGATKTITLPVCSGSVVGTVYHIKKLSASNTTVIARSGSDTIDGATSYTLSVRYQAITVACTATNVWSIF